jgi:outer membrane protein TolC
MTRRRARGLIRLVVFMFAAGGCAALRAQTSPEVPDSLTLEQALEEAHRANAQLPEAQYRVQQARARARQARGELYPKLSIDGDLHGGAPQSYASNDSLARVLAQTPIYEGGELRAGVKRSDAETDSSVAGYQMSVREVDRAVRVAYGRILRDESTLQLDSRAIDRLQTYLAAVRARQAAGQGLGADALRTRQRLASAQADWATARRDLDDGTMELNDLLGRAPDAALSLAPLPDPKPPLQSIDQPWLATPDIEQAEADIRAQQAGVQAARAGRRPRVTLEADVGVQSSAGSNLAPLNNGSGSGGQILLNFSVPFWDKGVFRARMDEANAALGEARQRKLVVERAARLAWMQAVNGVADLYTEFRARGAAAVAARDAYLQAESLYRGGQGTALEVLDAHDAWIQANQTLLDVIYDYRVAQADLDRWGTP